MLFRGLPDDFNTSLHSRLGERRRNQLSACTTKLFGQRNKHVKCESLTNRDTINKKCVYSLFCNEKCSVGKCPLLYRTGNGIGTSEGQSSTVTRSYNTWTELDCDKDLGYVDRTCPKTVKPAVFLKWKLLKSKVYLTLLT